MKNVFFQIERIIYLHNLIERGCTGTSKQLGKTLHVTQRMTYNYLEELKSLGAEIAYDRIQETFYYLNDFKLELKLKISIRSNLLNNSILKI